MLYECVNFFVLATCERGVFNEREVLGSANFSRISKCGDRLFEDLIQGFTLNFCGHGAKFYNVAHTSQWYERTIGSERNMFSP